MRRPAAPSFARAKAVRDSLNPVRQALRTTRPPEKPHAHQKYWQELLGQVGGAVRPPMLPSLASTGSISAGRSRPSGRMSSTR